MRSVSLVIAGVVLATAVAARATDQPISGAKLLLLSSGGVEKLVFVSKDPAFLFPTAGGADDPGTAGLQVDLISPVEPLGVSLAAPAGIGNLGWSTTSGTVPAHRFRNGAAPNALSSRSSC